MLLHELVESAADRSPAAWALSTKDTALTYADLDSAANHVTDELIARFAVRPGDLVAVALPPSPGLVTVILGVLKAGAAYVPVDVSHPAERIGFILADSAAKLLVTDESNAGLLSAVAPRIVTIEDIGTGGRGPGPVRVAAGPVDAAYVIYTSGSTGRPKGVVVEHRNIVASLLARREHYRRAPEVYGLTFSPAFDGAVGVIFWALAEGGCLYLPPEGADSPVNDLLWAGGIDRPVTDLCCVPSLYQFVLDQAPGQLAGLRRVIVAGEKCRPLLTRRHFEVAPQATLHNEYGPTETAIWSTVHDCAGATSDEVPIGLPISSATAEVLDRHLCPVPAGSVGELVVGGAGVARGYLNGPGPTAERFVPDPAVPGRRRYRTGDLVRRRADAELDFLGRADDQIKWNGHRIEPGEIEACLSRLPGVVEVAVVLNVSVPERPALTAFVRTSPAGGSLGGTFDQESLTAALRQRLPEFMVPARFVSMAELPRTGNGKIDRSALARRPLPEEAGTVTASHVAGDALEERLRDLVAQVLDLSQVPLDVHFFRLGADSLALMRIAAAARQQGFSVTTKDVLSARTVVGLAGFLRQ